MNAIEIAVLFVVGLTFLISIWRGQRPVGALPISRESRLARIGKFSWWAQALIGLSFVLWVYWILAFSYGWPFAGQGNVKIAITPNHVYSSAAEMPHAILVWWLVKMALTLICYSLLFSLFGLYRKGILFSAKCIRHIHGLAHYLIANWLLNYQLQSTLHDVNLSSAPLLVALVIIFVAWIMDEARKIQEEQELTV